MAKLTFRLAVLLPLVACSSSDDDAPAPNLFDGYGAADFSIPTRQPLSGLDPLNPAASITGFTIAPALPDGLELDPVTGTIGGVPTGLSPAQTYTVSATDGAATDAEEFVLSVRAPIVGLSTDRDLVVTELLAGTPVAVSGAGVGLTATAPTVSTPGLVAVDMPQPSTSAVVATTDLSSTAPGIAPSPVDATTDFVATITIDDSELDDDDLWQFAAQAPYDDDGLAPGLPTFPFDTASVVTEDGTLGLDIELPPASIGPFDSGTLPTSHRSIEPLTNGVAFVGIPWTELDGNFYTRGLISTDSELYRYDPDGGPGGIPSLSIAADVDDMASGDVGINAVIAGRLIVSMRNAAGAFKTHAYDPASDELVEVADLAGVATDVTSEFLEMDGSLYFAGVDGMGVGAVYRYGFGGPSLERISDTSDPGLSEDPRDLLELDGMLYFLASDALSERHLYRFDPIFMTQERLSDDSIDPVEGLASAGGRIFVTGQNSQEAQKLFVFDPIAGSLRQITNTAGDENTDDNVEFLTGAALDPSDLYFTANNAAGAQKLYRYAGTGGAAAVEQLSNTAGTAVNDAIGNELVRMGDLIFFVARNTDSGRKLFALDTSTGLSTQVCNINSSELFDNTAGLLPVGTSKLAFAATILPGFQTEIFEYDLVSGVTKQLADINPGANDDASTLAVIGGKLVFSARDASGSQDAYTVE